MSLLLGVVVVVVVVVVVGVVFGMVSRELCLDLGVVSREFCLDKDLAGFSGMLSADSWKNLKAVEVRSCTSLFSLSFLKVFFGVVSRSPEEGFPFVFFVGRLGLAAGRVVVEEVGVEVEVGLMSFSAEKEVDLEGATRAEEGSGASRDVCFLSGLPTVCLAQF